jgi:hypothetical protein
MILKVGALWREARMREERKVEGDREVYHGSMFKVIPPQMFKNLLLGLNTSQ